MVFGRSGPRGDGEMGFFWCAPCKKKLGLGIPWAHVHFSWCLGFPVRWSSMVGVESAGGSGYDSEGTIG